MRGQQDISALFNSGGAAAFRRITFVPAISSDSQTLLVTPGVDLVPLNDPINMPSTSKASLPKGSGISSKTAARELFKEADVQLSWDGIRKVGAGLQNLGNTCFMNSVLQCLTHTAPLAQLFLSQKVFGTPNSADLLYIAQLHVRNAFKGQPVIAPAALAQALRQVNKRFRLGRQEDAHEYLRCLLDAMHESCLRAIKPKPPPDLAQTTLIYRIFGGRLRSQIRCDGIDYESSTFEPFLDLSLEISKATSVERALQHFTAPEVLDGPNKYRCPKNNKLVRAYKQMSIEQAPNVLTIHLKRFEFGMFGSKISKRVDFGLQLDLGPYMSTKSLGKHVYDVYGVLVHHGHSLHSGHYICYVRSSAGMWHVCDDARVAQVGERQVQSQQAYILFYIRRTPCMAAAGSSAAAAAAAAAMTATVAAASSNAAHSSGSSNLSSQTVINSGKQQHLPAAAAAASAAAAAKAAAAGDATASKEDADALQPLRKKARIAEAEGTAAAALKPAAAAVVKSLSSVESNGGSPRAAQQGPALDRPLKLSQPPATPAAPVTGIITSSTESTADVTDHTMQTRTTASHESQPESPARSPSPSSHATAPHHTTYQLPRCLNQSKLGKHLATIASIMHHKITKLKRLRRRALRTASTSLAQPSTAEAELAAQPHGSGAAAQAAQGSGAAASLRFCSGALASTSAPTISATAKTPRTPTRTMPQRAVATEAQPAIVAANAAERKGQLVKQAAAAAAVAEELEPQDEAQPSPLDLGPLAAAVQPSQIPAKPFNSEHHLAPAHQAPAKQPEVVVGAAALQLLDGGMPRGVGRGAVSGHIGSCAMSSRWEDVDEAVAQQADALLTVEQRQQQRAAAKRKLDEWDEEYDMGKVKKVRNKNKAGADLHADGNAFQQWQQERIAQCSSPGARARNMGGHDQRGAGRFGGPPRGHGGIGRFGRGGRGGGGRSGGRGGSSGPWRDASPRGGRGMGGGGRGFGSGGRGHRGGWGGRGRRVGRGGHGRGPR